MSLRVLRSCPALIPARTISASTQVQGGDFNLYENMRCHGVPLVTISRGRVVYENGVFMCAEGTGKFCPLRSFPDIVYKKLVQREKVRGAGRKMCGKRPRPLGASSLPSFNSQMLSSCILCLHRCDQDNLRGGRFQKR